MAFQQNSTVSPNNKFQLLTTTHNANSFGAYVKDFHSCIFVQPFHICHIISLMFLTANVHLLICSSQEII
jgi:hypothetical protein